MVVSNVMRTALVTGGAGFLGTAVVRTLERDGITVTVAGTGSVSDPLTPARIAGALETVPDVVVHCAGTSSVAASVADPVGEHAKTVLPFAALLAQLRLRAPAARVVLLSSAAVYGNAAVVPTPETAPLLPLSPYGEHKRECEELCRAHGDAGYPAAIVRLFSVYGAGLRKQLLWDACRKAIAGVPAFAGTGREERDWLHVRDAVDLILTLARHASRDVPVINGGTGRGVTVREVVGHVCRALGSPEPTFSGETRPGDPQRYVADITRAVALGWTPTIGLARGIADYVAWFRALA